MKITGNTILITGGTSGIGLAMAIRFKSLHNRVVITGRNKFMMEQLSAQFGLDYYCCDLTQPDELNGLIDQIQEYGINMLINNAGIQYCYPEAEYISFDKIDEEIMVNFNALTKLSTGIIPMLKSQSESAIINVSSGLAISPKKSAPIYCATKAAVHAYTKALRYQLEHSGIKVFEVLPPLVDTPMTSGRGKNKLKPEKLVDEMLMAIQDDKYEINIGKVKLLRLIHRISPYWADQLLKHN